MSPTGARWLAWSMWAGSLALGVAGIPLQAVAGLEPGDPVFLLIFIVMLFATIGLLIASRQPRNAIGWIFLAAGATWAASGLAQSYALYALETGQTSSALARVADWSGQWNWMPATFLAPTLIALLFPNGRPLSPRWRPAVWAAGGLTALLVFTIAVAPGPLEDPAFLQENPFALEIPGAVLAIVDGIGALGWFAVFGASIVSLALRLRRSRGEERQQIKWLAFALGIAVVILAAGFLIHGIAGVDSTTLAGNILIALILAALAFIPVAAGIAILKHRLFDIDVVINKTVVFGLLAAFITAVYLGVVVGVGTLVGSSGNLVLSGIAAGILAVAFQPVRQRAQRLANRLVYGRRATPYEVLSEFADRAAATYATEDLLPRMARILGEGTGAARADVWLRIGGLLRPEAAWPDDGQPPGPVDADGNDLPQIEGVNRVVPVRYQGELLGALSVVKKPGDPLTPTEEKLLEHLASQAGLVLRNARLTEELLERLEELRASRQRLVTAQDEERRRIERNIHDGAQQQLVALAVKLRLADALVGMDEERAHSLLVELQAETNATLEDLRDLARGIYPPLLAEEGLAAAVEVQARKSPVPVSVEADSVGRYSQEVEAAVYFCCLEALQNISKYANASQVRVRLSAGDRELRFEVEDDGVGFDPTRIGYGTGLQGMADRLDAIGGALRIDSEPGRGTSVRGSVPVRDEARGSA